MGIRKYKPTTPGRRGSSVADFVELTRSTPEKSLLVPSPKTGGRNNAGKITTRHIGGGHKQAYRLIDFKRYDKDGVPAKVAHIEYDPNRTARIALCTSPTARSATSSRRTVSVKVARSRLARAPTSSRATTCRCATSRSVPRSTQSNSGLAVAPSSPARPAPASSWSPARARTPRSGCRPAKCGWSTYAAVPPWARSATPSSPTSAGARRAVTAGRASGRAFVGWR